VFPGGNSLAGAPTVMSTTLVTTRQRVMRRRRFGDQVEQPFSTRIFVKAIR
jgi:hypothetical protein